MIQANNSVNAFCKQLHVLGLKRKASLFKTLLGVFSTGDVEVHKLILLGAGEEINNLRAEAESTFAGRASLTTGIGGMLEVCKERYCFLFS